MTVFVLSCLVEGEFRVLGVYNTIFSLLETLPRQHFEEGERIEDFAAVDGQHSVVYTNMATYYIDEHIVEGLEDEK